MRRDGDTRTVYGYISDHVVMRLKPTNNFKEGNTMARCYYLDYESKGFLSSYGSDEYVCKLCGKHFATNDPQVKYTCNADYGEEYQKCPVYRDRR